MPPPKEPPDPNDLPWATIAATPFQGETMTCFRCGDVERSRPSVESGWYAIDLYDDNGNVRRVYWCGRCR